MASRLPYGRRFEMTNLDVAALEDLGWSVIDSDVEDPVAAADLRVARTADGLIGLSWTSLVGASYTIQTSSDLADWDDQPAVIASSTTTTWQDQNPPTAGSKHYRIVTD